MSLQNTLDFIKQYLAESEDVASNLSGKAFLDLVLQPAAILFQPFVDDLNEIITHQSLLAIKESNDPEVFDKERIDKFLENMLIQRSEGVQATGIINLVLSTRQTIQADAGQMTFFSDSGIEFVNSSALLFSSAGLDSYAVGDTFVLPIALTAVESGTDGNIDPSDDPIVGFIGLSPIGTVTIEHTSSFTGGVAEQSNLDIITLAQSAISTRTLITTPAIDYNLTKNFSFITRHVVIGKGEQEMMRDVIHNAHCGGFVDIFCKTNAVSTETEDFSYVTIDYSRVISNVSYAGFDPADTDPNRGDLGVLSITKEERDPVLSDPSDDFQYTEDREYTFDNVSNDDLLPNGEVIRIYNAVALINIPAAVGCTITSTGTGDTKVIVLSYPGYDFTATTIERGDILDVVTASDANDQGGWYIDEVGYNGVKTALRLYYDMTKNGGRDQASVGTTTVTAFQVFQSTIASTQQVGNGRTVTGEKFSRAATSVSMQTATVMRISFNPAAHLGNVIVGGFLRTSASAQAGNNLAVDTEIITVKNTAVEKYVEVINALGVTEAVTTLVMSYRASADLFGDATVDFIKLGVKAGDLLEIESGSAQGSYLVERVGPQYETGVLLKVGGFFPTATTGLNYKITGRARADYDYNPISLDVQREVRTNREGATITNVPLLLLREIQLLDSFGNIERELNGPSGYGDDVFGEGQYGSGAYDYHVRIINPIERYAPTEESLIVFSKDLLNRSFKITYDHESRLQSVQDYVESASDRSIAADLLVRHFVPVYLSFDIVYDVLSENETVAPTADELLVLVQDYINSYDTTEFEVSQLVSFLFTTGYAANVSLPLYVRAAIYNTDGSIEEQTSENVIAPNFEAMPSYSEKILTPRVCGYLPGTITITRTLVDAI